MAAKFRNLLIVLVVFAVSPLSVCAQIVCDISCSFQEATVPDSGHKSSKPNQILTTSVNHSTRMHCHEAADADGASSSAFRNLHGACHKDNCASYQIGAVPAIPQGKSSTAPAHVIGVEASTVIALATPALVALHRLRNSRTIFSEVLAASRTLRI